MHLLTPSPLGLLSILSPPSEELTICRGLSWLSHSSDTEESNSRTTSPKYCITDKA